MMEEGRIIIEKYMKYWRLLRMLEAFFYGIGVALLCWFFFKNILLSLGILLLVVVLVLLFLKPWKIGVDKVTTYLDHHLKSVEHSTSLLLTTASDLSGIAQLQQKKITPLLQSEIQKIRPKTGLRESIISAIVLIIIGVVGSHFFLGSLGEPPIDPASEQLMVLQPTDTVAPAHTKPRLVKQELTLSYPRYTRVQPVRSENMSVKVVEGTTLSWELIFEGPIKEVTLEGFAKDKKLNLRAEAMSNVKATGRYLPTSSGYYNFKFSDSLGANYISDVYAVELLRDQAPVVNIKDIAQFTSFDYNENKVLLFSTEITDDFGIEAANIIATVSKGSGESVKFREETLVFDQRVSVGSKSLRLTKKIKLDQLQMGVGDELYFYVEARDQKKPRSNITRSETFFAVINDTLSGGFSVEGTMGADLMPDYFRSQRQLIIDTEKLIKERSRLTDQEFKSRSNDLGFDQKSLRLKYGQFMGDEDDSGIAITPEIPEEDFDPEDPTAGFRHDHDSENEHNLVEEGHDHEEDQRDDNDEKSPLENYVHNHDDPEESTLFTESLRGKLQNAMAQMWDSELHLRLANPQNSLPYQYKALKLIQEIKNSARIYVHRIGFDPPPIKEDKRLSGDITSVDNVYKQQDLQKQSVYPAMRESIYILEKCINENEKLNKTYKKTLSQAGEELALLAIQEPAKHLKTLQQLKWLTEDKVQPKSMFQSVQQGLLQALPNLSTRPSNQKRYLGDLEKLFMNELNDSDR